MCSIVNEEEISSDFSDDDVDISTYDISHQENADYADVDVGMCTQERVPMCVYVYVLGV